MILQAQILVLCGSQRLTALRDSIHCVHEQMAKKTRRSRPSAYFCIQARKTTRQTPLWIMDSFLFLIFFVSQYFSFSSILLYLLLSVLELFEWVLYMLLLHSCSGFLMFNIKQVKCFKSFPSLPFHAPFTPFVPSPLPPISHWFRMCFITICVPQQVSITVNPFLLGTRNKERGMRERGQGKEKRGEGQVQARFAHPHMRKQIWRGY